MIRPATDETIREAVALLRAGALVAFPTETVYGLGADATSDMAVAEIFAVKDRPRFNPLIVHVVDTDAAAALVVLDARARALAARFWPGPLTIVARRRDGCPVSLLASAGLESLAVRAPAHATARALLAAAAVPVAAPSANRAGALSPTSAVHVADSLGERVSLILDAGACPVGIESTIIDLSGEMAMLLRPGAIGAEEIAAVTGPLAAAPHDTAPAAPGMLASHYAPRLPVRLEADAAAPGEALLGFGPAPAAERATLNLSPSGSLREAAANLFAHLHALDQPRYTAIAVMPIPEAGLGRAINDRLRRAAAPRPLAGDDAVKHNS